MFEQRKHTAVQFSSALCGENENPDLADVIIIASLQIIQFNFVCVCVLRTVGFRALAAAGVDPAGGWRSV